MSRFRVALSFAGEKQPYVEQVAAILAHHFGKDGVLYYPYHEAELSRRDLPFLLPKFYHRESDVIAVFLCPEYDQSKWCGLEWLAIHDLFQDRLDEKVVLCRFGRATADGLYSGTGYVELDDKPPEYAATRILERLALNEGRPRDYYLLQPLQAAPSRLSSASPALVGRDAELVVLDEAWRGPKKKNVVTIVAWGGVGKTALVGHWAAEKLTRPDHGGINRYFDWPFYSQGTLHERDATGAESAASSDLFFRTALEFFGDPDFAAGSATAWQKGERLARLVSRPGTLLILDALETLQEVKSGKLRDQGLQALLRSLAVTNEGLCLVTSRQSISDVATYRETSAPELRLAGLSTSGGTELLKTLGVKGPDPEIERLAGDVKGHALTLTLLGKYLGKAHDGDVRRRDQVRVTEADYEETSGHAFRVIDAYEHWLAKDGRQVELAILRILGLSDRPLTPDAIEALKAPLIHGLTNTLATVTPAQWNVAVKLLAELGIVEEQRWEPPKIFGYSEQEAKENAVGKPHLWRSTSQAGTVLDTHPLIREYCGQQLRDSDAQAWQSAHNVLFEHLRDSVPYWPEGLVGLQPLYQAVAHGCEAGRYDEACTAVYYRRILRGERAYSTRVLGTFGADLAAVRCFFLTPWTHVVPGLSAANQAWLLAEASFRLHGLGRLTEARPPVQASLDLAVDQETWADAAIRAANLADLELITGDLVDSVRHAEQSVAFADRSENPFQRYAGRSSLGTVLHQCGRTDEARWEFENAERLQAKADPFIPFLYSARGFHYCDLLLGDIERAAWRAWILRNRTPAAALRFGRLISARVRDRALMMLHLAMEMRSSLSTAYAQLTATRAEFYESLLQGEDPRRLASNIDEIVHVMRESGSVAEVPRALLTGAWRRVAIADIVGARADLDEAQQIAELGPMPLHLADVHLHRARLFFRDDPTGAREDLVCARTLIEKHGYLRRIEELEDAESAIGELRV